MKSRIALALLAGIALVGCSSASEDATPDTTPAPVETPDTTMATDSHTDSDGDGTHHDHSAMAGGLGTSATVDGFTLSISAVEATTTGSQELGFVISSDDGTPVTSFEEHHEKTMHMIIFKHDLTDYQHVHPEMDASGTWTVPVSFSTAGVYHVVADFVSAGKPVVLGTDVQIAGGAMSMASFSAESRTSVSGPYTATLVGDTAHEGSSALKVEFTKDGSPVESVNPYLGANAHMVAINPATLGYTHMHPNDGFPGGVMTFTAPAMDHGFFKVFLQADFDGEIRLFEFVFEGK